MTTNNKVVILFRILSSVSNICIIIVLCKSPNMTNTEVDDDNY
jgi:hypothetical protein